MADNDVEIKVGATTDDVETAIRRVVTTMESLKDPVSSVLTALGGAELNQAVGIFREMAGAVVDVVREMTDLGLQTERTMVILGTSAEEVGKLGFVAQASGNSIETVGVVMSRLSFNLEKAAKGASPVNDALEALGLNARQLLDMDLDHRMMAISDAFHNAADSGGKTAAAIQLLGRTAISLLPMLNKGSEAYKELSDVAERAGIVLTGPTVDAFERTRLKVIEFSDALKEGVIITLFSAFEPAINGAADVMNNLVERFNDGLKGSGALAISLTGLAGIAKVVVTGISSLVTSVVLLLEALEVTAKETARALMLVGTELEDLFTFNFSAMSTDFDAAFALMKGDAIAFGASFKEEVLAWKATFDDIWSKPPAGPGAGAGNAVDPAAIAAARAASEQMIALKEKLATGQLAIDTELATAERAQFQISENQKFAMLQAAQDKEYAAQKSLLEQEAALYANDVPKRQKILDQITVLEQAHSLASLKITEQQIAAQQAVYQKYFDFLQGESNTVLADFLHGITSWRDEFRKVMQDLTLFVAKLVEEWVFKWAAGQLATSTATAAGETAKTAATTAGVAARSGVEEAGLLTTAIASINSSVAQVFAGVSAFFAPVAGPGAPALAAPIAANVEATSMGMLAFAAGAWELPSNTIAQLHQGEMVVPATFAEGMRNGGGGMGGGETHIHIHNPIGTREWFDANHEYLADAMQTAARNLHPATQRQYGQ